MLRIFNLGTLFHTDFNRQSDNPHKISLKCPAILKAEILALAPVLLVTANTEFEREWGESGRTRAEVCIKIAGNLVLTTGLKT